MQDRSPQRNHRPTIWGVWGVDQAINGGLALSCYARLALDQMEEQDVSPGIILEVHRMLEETVIELCHGQYLDLDFRNHFPTLDEYLEMVRLKTGVLVGAACEVGALVAGAPDKRAVARKFGEALGVAFQLQDDILGVWGDSKITGKPVNDLAAGKVTLPLVFMHSILGGTYMPSTVEELDHLGTGALMHQLVSRRADDAKCFLAALPVDGAWYHQLSALGDLVAQRTQ